MVRDSSVPSRCRPVSMGRALWRGDGVRTSVLRMKMNGKSREIDMTCAVPYASDGEAALLGDLYRPVDRGPHPIIIAVHGGGWDQGSRDCYHDWGIYLAERGYALFATD